MRQVQWVGDATLTVNDVGGADHCQPYHTMPAESDDGLGHR